MNGGLPTTNFKHRNKVRVASFAYVEIRSDGLHYHEYLRLSSCWLNDDDNSYHAIMDRIKQQENIGKSEIWRADDFALISITEVEED